MKTLTITDFKDHALQILGQVAETREPVVVTRRGKKLAKVVPFSGNKPIAGRLSGALVFENDIVSPLGNVEAQYQRCLDNQWK